MNKDKNRSCGRAGCEFDGMHTHLDETVYKNSMNKEIMEEFDANFPMLEEILQPYIYSITAVKSFIQSSLDKAREEGIQQGMKDILVVLEPYASQVKSIQLQEQQRIKKLVEEMKKESQHPTEWSWNQALEELLKKI